MVLSPQAVRATLLIRWGDALTEHTNSTSEGGQAASHGLRVAARHAVGGAREEGALGFPSVFDIALPQLQATLAAGRDWRCAKTDALFALMAHVSDTNVYHRGGAAGAALVQHRSRAFLTGGGTADAAWLVRAEAIHHEFVERRLSPGGAADLLAAACLIHTVCGGELPA
jgi:triphosphoribosyl-dephospho-CoA synthase